MAEKDYYAILGVDPRAPARAIEKAYWCWVRELRGRGQGAWATCALAALNEAYDHLGNPQKRSSYNQALGMAVEPPTGRTSGWFRRLWPR